MNDVFFTDHAIERFVRRFPLGHLEDSFARSQPMTDKEIRKIGKLCDKAYYDEQLQAVFICKYDERDRAREFCVTVLKKKDGHR